jgi:hypothetical protein
MSQYTFADLNPDTDTGTTLSLALNEWKNAVQSTNLGITVPTYKAAGMMWVDTTGGTSWDLKIYDGTDSITLVTIDTSTNSTSIGSISSGTIITDEATSTATADGDSNALIIDSNVSTGMSVLTSDAGDASLFLGSASDNKGAYLTWNYTATNLTLATHLSTGNVLIGSGLGVTAMYIKSNQNIGIGTNDPKGKLHIKSGSSTRTTWAANKDHLIIEGDTEVGMTIAGLNTAVLRYGFSNAGAQTSAQMEWDYTNSNLNLSTGVSGGNVCLLYGSGTEGLRVDGTAGYVGIGQTDPKGNVHIGTSVNATFNTFENTTDLIIGNATTSSVLIQGGTSASISLIDTGSTADGKRFDIVNDGDMVTIRLVSDDGLTETDMMEFHADGDIYFPQLLAISGYAHLAVTEDGKLRKV